MSYPNRKRVQEWYLTARDGISNLASLLGRGHQPDWITAATHGTVFGMTHKEWKAFHDEKQEDHEIAASLALLATCEGAIRRDLEKRIADQGLHHAKLRPLIKPGRHVSIIVILQRWRKVVGETSYAHKHIKRLEDIYTQSRNPLAHGRARHGEFTFNLISDRLDAVERKWKEAISDFMGF